MNKNDKGFLQGGLDPAVAAAIGGGTQRQNERSMPRQERAKIKKNQERQEKRNGNRAVYDMHPDVIKAIAAIAEIEHCSASNVAEIALRIFLAAKVIDVRKYRVPVKHPKFECRLEWKD